VRRLIAYHAVTYERMQYWSRVNYTTGLYSNSIHRLTLQCVVIAASVSRCWRWQWHKRPYIS